MRSTLSSLVSNALSMTVGRGRRIFGERLGEVDQLRRPDAVQRPAELPQRDLERK